MQDEGLQHKAFFSWSGGKDSALCLHKAIQSKHLNIACLLTNINAVHNRVSMHGVRRSLLQMQAASIGILLQTIELNEQPTMEEYELAMMNKIDRLKAEGCTQAVYGDIFLEDLKLYREQKLKEAGIECVFPLWKISSADLIEEFISLHFKAIVVCVNEQYLDKSFCGRIIDESFINDLPAHIDVCGENGEFHSFVFDGPIFNEPVKFIKGEIIHNFYNAPVTADNKSQSQPHQYGFYFCDLLPY